MLATGDIANLAGRRPVFFGNQRPRHTRKITQQHIDVTGNVIVANHADKRDGRPHRHQVAHDIAGTAEHRGLVRHAAYRDRRFGRHTTDIAIYEAIEHDIADADHLCRWKVANARGEGSVIGRRHQAHFRSRISHSI